VLDASIKMAFKLFEARIREKGFQDALEISEEKYRSIFNQSVAGIYLHDLEGRIIDVNDMACTQSGYSREELQNMTMFQCQSNTNNSPNLPINEILRLWNQWQPNQKHTYEAAHQRKDGTMYPVEISTGIVHYGSKDLLQAVVLDITERKKTEAALEAETLRSRMLFEQSPDGVLVIDPWTARFIEFSRAAHRQLGYTREEFSQRSVMESRKDRNGASPIWNTPRWSARPRSFLVLLLRFSGTLAALVAFPKTTEENGIRWRRCKEHAKKPPVATGSILFAEELEHHPCWRSLIDPGVLSGR